MRSLQMKKMYLLSITLISLGILAGCSNNDSTKVQKLETTISSLKKENDSLKTGNTDENKKSQESKVDSKQKKEEKKYGLNEDVDLYSNSKKVGKIKLTKVSTNQSAFPDYMINLEDYDTSKMMAVTFDYTNIAMEEPFLPHSNYFQAYSKDGKALQSFNQQNGQDYVSQGRTGTSTIYFGIPVDGNSFDEVELDLVPTGSAKIATFDIAVGH
ncbi:TPA: hypothetical protein IUX51_001299 [Enterococcus faecalis]|nr:hypothetical protein [Enterococcus faecalis]EHE8491328.1 hypothetical protein [Enterococcus faecalis]NSO30657.1 hypothetical protein [Enterococcus faecalis]NSQ47708.1 hypothetical protein [Enterococcus faecalis]HAP4875707.1 hypothetical protein [Enterococcus faecalis]